MTAVERNLADGPGFDSMVIGAVTRLGQARPREIVRDLAVYGRCTVQAVTAALGRGAERGYVRRHPNGCWSR